LITTLPIDQPEEVKRIFLSAGCEIIVPEFLWWLPSR